MGTLIRAISADGGVLISAADAADIISDMETIHKTSATASGALGRTLIAASLMGSMLKNETETLTLRIMGRGTIGSILAVSDCFGNVRGYCDNPLADLPVNRETGKLDVSGIVGREGLVAVIRDFGLKEPHVGQVPLISGEIAEDITNYFAVSEQTPTVCALGVLVNPDLSIKAAGGYIAQLLPGAEEDAVAQLEKNIALIPPVTAMLGEGKTVLEIIGMVLNGLSPEVLDEHGVSYLCKCSEERMEKVLIGLGGEELRSLAGSGEDTEIVCSFCNKKYRFSPGKLYALLKAST